MCYQSVEDVFSYKQTSTDEQRRVFRNVETKALVDEKTYPRLDLCYQVMYNNPRTKSIRLTMNHIKKLSGLQKTKLDIYDYGRFIFLI